jgi:hypothetical protein
MFSRVGLPKLAAGRPLKETQRLKRRAAKEGSIQPLAKRRPYLEVEVHFTH